MTATLAPPPPPPPPSAPPRPATHPTAAAARRPRGPWVTELLLLAVTLVAVAGFTRLFADRAAVVPLLLAAVGAHGTSALCRRLGWGVLPTVVAVTGAFALQASIVLYPHTSGYGLPTPATIDAVLDDLARAWELFGQVKAPAPRSRGFLLASSFTLWVAVGLADWAAFRLRTIAEAVLPAGSVFVFTTLLGAGRGGVALTALLVAAMLAFAAAQRAGRSGRDDAWVGGRSSAGTAALARTGALVALAVAVVSGLLGPHLPTAGDDALVDWRGNDGPDGRTTVSPLVDIRSRLVEQSNATVFTVRSPRPAYWRLTSLPVFDGQVWRSKEDFGDADGDLPSEPPEATTEEVLQEFTIRRLGNIWAPAATTPTELVESSIDMRWNGELATLIVPRDTDTVDGLTYTVVSRVPSFAPEDLDARQPDDLPEDVEEATTVPAGLPPVVAETAAEIVADTDGSPYAQALALQDWFRANFVYDLDVGSGHSGNAIEAFLAAGRGYCEQFAGTYAAMARTLGLPARVAVGFTPGDPRADGTGYTVRGRNAHAWPEVWISGAGWVPFEPTPGRGQPGAQDYTGVAPDQASEAEDLPEVTTSTASTAPPTPTTGGAGPTVPPGEETPETTASPLTDTGDGGPPGWVVATLAVLLVGVVLLVLDVVAIAVVRARRGRRRQADASTAGRVRAAWGRTLDALRLVGVAPAPAETAREFARRAGDDLGAAGPSLSRLAGILTATTWAPATAHPAVDLVHQADELADRVTDEVHGDAGWRPRLRTAIDPRLLRSR